MNVLVGYTGFVGSNLYECGMFDQVFNSKNIESAYGLQPDLLIYAGLRAEKYLANHEPEKDMEMVRQAQKNIELIAPKRLVLISTIDVFRHSLGKTEENEVEMDGLHAYGYHRWLLECWVREHYPEALIVRLPGLFGRNIKKNFIYDLIHRLPFMLQNNLFMNLSGQEPLLQTAYRQLKNGFWQLQELDQNQKEALQAAFTRLHFSAVQFTDSRSVFQFYPLARLWKDIQMALQKRIRVLHLATEPVSAAEVYRYVTGEEFENEVTNAPALYGYRSVYAEDLGGNGSYLLSKEEVLEAIRDFVKKKDQ